MKKLIAIIALISTTATFAQHKVAAHVEQLIQQKVTFEHFMPLLAADTKIKADAGIVKNAQHAIIDKAVVANIAATKYNTIELDIPYNGQTVTVLLYKVNLLAEGFHVDTDKGINASFERGAHYRGIVKGDDKSVASFNFFKDEVNGIISADGLNNLVIARLQEKGNTSDYILYSDADLTILPNYTCSTEDPDTNDTHRDANGTQDVLSNRCVTIYFEIDNNIFVQNGSSVTQTNNWMTSVFNNVQTLYANDGITTALKSTFIWTTQDPYTGDSSGDYLEQFHQVRPTFDGDLGQLVGIDPGGLGGVAVNIAGICSNFNWSYSDVDFNFSNVPLFSWTVQVITHELGHLMGSPHTHGCYWNGNNTAIDGCGSSQGYVEGNCPQGPIPSSTQKGTIMSYCHLVGGVGIKFSNGFGPQPAARILNHVESSSCLSTDCVNTCINAISRFTVNTTQTSATISWTDPSNTGPWEVSIAPYASAFSVWQTVDVNTITVNGLNVNSYYKIAVKPVCAAGVTTTTEQLIFMTDGDFCSGLTFTDTGGNGNYGNNQHLIRTVKPTVAGAKIKATFTSFNLEENYDYLYIYDGPSIDAPLLDTVTGDFTLGVYQSSSPDGALTFEFVSDEGVTASGWKITLSCANLSTKENSFIDFRYYPNPTNGIVTISSAEVMDHVTVYNVAGQLLMDRKINDTETRVDIASFAEGVYFFKVNNGTKEANFRVIKQE